MKNHWLDRTLVKGLFVTLCLSQEEFTKELKRLGINYHVDFLPTSHANAAAQFLDSPDGKRCAIVCLGDTSGVEPIQVAGMLVHEAVHIFDEFCETIGEKTPSSEFMAYSIQSISSALMYEYARRIG